MQKEYYSYEIFLKDIKALKEQIEPFNPDTLLAVARGGLTLGHFLAIAMENRQLFTINSIHYDKECKLETVNIFNIPNLCKSKRVVVIDDIADSGETLKLILTQLKEKYPDIDFKVATLFFKPSSLIQPDFTIKEAKGWIDFFWEIDPL